MTHSIDDLKFRDGGTWAERREAGNKPHVHRCMRCNEEFECRNAGLCMAKYDVLPNIIIGGTEVVPHCPETPDWNWIREYGKRMRELWPEVSK